MSSQDPAQLTDYLLLGSVSAAQNKDHLQKLGVTHIVNVADDVECFYPRSFEYLHCKVIDGGEDKKIVSWFPDATKFVQGAREAGGKVLVHCLMGINRSATVAMAVLMNIEGLTLDAAYELARSRRGCVSPFPGNRNFIASWELETRSHCSMPDWLPSATRKVVGHDRRSDALPASSAPAHDQGCSVLTGNDQSVTHQELETVLRSLGAAQEDVQKLVRQFAGSRDGVLKLQDFIDWVMADGISKQE